jgi:NAD(P)-dependent dehydrogenase (short-subunit alcohol dehydrogenase family)
MRGKVVRIAGASGGIGSASATGIAKLGAITVVVVGCDPNRAEGAAVQVLEDTGSIAEGA